MSSICQIGIVAFEDGQDRRWALKRATSTRVTNSDPYNVAIHGITEDDVRCTVLQRPA